MHKRRFRIGLTTKTNNASHLASSERTITSQTIRAADLGLRKVQNLFPYDNLGLALKDPFSETSKNYSSKQSKDKAVRSTLRRALSGKSKILLKENKNNFDAYSCENPKVFRQYVMESPVTITVGMQSQQRSLFLFTDILLIAKERSQSAYKLKERVRISELWLGDCMQEVCEVTLPTDTSFVIGWPTTNVVVTFRTAQLKSLWNAKLHHLISEAKLKEPRVTTINVIASFSNHPHQDKQLKVTSVETVRDCKKKILRIFYLNEENYHDYQLWVKTVFEPAPYPLVGHEFPFAIKMNCVWTLLNGGHNCGIYPSIGKCVFILKSVKKSLMSYPDLSNNKGKTKRKLIMNRVFRRCASKPEFVVFPSAPSGFLFGQSLSSLCHNNELPKPIMDILLQLYLKGPYTHGIFRKSANTKACREFREKLDMLQDCKFENYNIILLASVFKEFLRSLPDCLLGCSFYNDWLELARFIPNINLYQITILLEKLPTANLLLLEYFLCVVWHVALNAKENQMTSSNLAVCIGPSLLWSQKININPESSKKIPVLVEFLIKKFPTIFGKDVLCLYDNHVQKIGSRQDSGAEESDSMNSCGLPRDDSSLDSLERLHLDEGGTYQKLPNKAKMSLSNLSRDSGLTMSDTQLYSPEEDEISQSSRNFSPSKDMILNTSAQFYRMKDKRIPIYKRAVSVSEITKSSEESLQSEILARSHLKQIPVTQSQTMKSDRKIRCKKETHKRRLARPRQWYNPRIPWDPDDISPVSTLRKSSSEENLLTCHVSQRSEAEQNSLVRKLINSDEYQSSRMSRSVSFFNLLSENNSICNASADSVLWHRTQSTPHLDDATYDSSTVSDDDSTPHVSRSNSRGKDCTSGKVLNPEDACTSFSYRLPDYEETITRQSYYRQISDYGGSTNWSPSKNKNDCEKLNFDEGEIYFASPVQVENSGDNLAPALPPKPNKSKLKQWSVSSSSPQKKVSQCCSDQCNSSSLPNAVSRIYIERPQFRCKDDCHQSKAGNVTKLRVNGSASNEDGSCVQSWIPSSPVKRQNRVTSTAKIVLTIKCGKSSSSPVTAKPIFSEESYV